MFCLPSEVGFSQFISQISPASYIRILHASPGSPPVDVYANERLIARNLSYRNFTQYSRIPPGTYNIKIFRSGQQINPILSTNMTIAARTITTIAAIGTLPNIGILPVPDPVFPTRPGRAYVKFVHLSPNAPAVDLTLTNGTKLFSNVSYKGITSYIPLIPRRYDLQLRIAGTNNIVLHVPNIHFLPNRNYTIYAIGLVGERPSLQVLIPQDGSTYLPV